MAAAASSKAAAAAPSSSSSRVQYSATARTALSASEKLLPSGACRPPRWPASDVSVWRLSREAPPAPRGCQDRPLAFAITMPQATSMCGAFATFSRCSSPTAAAASPSIRRDRQTSAAASAKATHRAAASAPHSSLRSTPSSAPTSATSAASAASTAPATAAGAVASSAPRAPRPACMRTSLRAMLASSRASCAARRPSGASPAQRSRTGRSAPSRPRKCPSLAMPRPPSPAASTIPDTWKSRGSSTSSASMFRYAVVARRRRSGSSAASRQRRRKSSQALGGSLCATGSVSSTSSSSARSAAGSPWGTAMEYAPGASPSFPPRPVRAPRCMMLATSPARSIVIASATCHARCPFLEPAHPFRSFCSDATVRSSKSLVSSSPAESRDESTCGSATSAASTPSRLRVLSATSRML